MLVARKLPILSQWFAAMLMPTQLTDILATPLLASIPSMTSLDPLLQLDIIQRGAQVEVWRYSDAGHAGNKGAPRGRSGYVFMTAGAKIS